MEESADVLGSRGEWQGDGQPGTVGDLCHRGAASSLRTPVAGGRVGPEKAITLMGRRRACAARSQDLLCDASEIDGETF